MSRYLCDDCGRPIHEDWGDLEEGVCALCDTNSGCHASCCLSSGWVKHAEHGLICEDCACGLPPVKDTDRKDREGDARRDAAKDDKLTGDA